MANNRQAIRAQLKTLLINAATSAGSNVFNNRETSLWQAELPAILIYTTDEPLKPESLRSGRYIRELELVIKVKRQESATIDDDLDTLIAQVEVVLDANRSIGGTVISSVQTNTQLSIEAEGEKLIGVGTITYQCHYIS